MTNFLKQVVSALNGLANDLGEVSASYEEIAGKISGATAQDVHSALINLKDKGHFSQTHFTSDIFIGRIRGSGGAFFEQLKAVLASKADKVGKVSATYEEIATDLHVSADAVHQGIIHLKDEGYFLGKPTLTSDFFAVQLG